ncbi:hypothetical protein [Tabrizicola soli]|uniref:Uncharacterized protein n=1 Tax=Tabrizicola soli TaxID=2185115 RepID=A0ABV7DZC5_9RHOB|nr:hypothetical protein [Tabrizicola soli]
MFWLGRLNAILAIVAFVGLVIVWSIQGPAGAAGWLIIMLLVRVAIRILDVVWTAATGNPLFYHTKLLDRRDE